MEDFIHTKAIEFAKQRIAVSYLVFAEQEGHTYFVGYYTLANKFVCVNSSSLSKTMQKKNWKVFTIRSGIRSLYGFYATDCAAWQKF